ncbi:MAG: carboxypeptidase regulatory-like domain-containing protein [Candidatus Cryptobacteroides sp.]
MNKKILMICVSLFCSLSLFAQSDWGGVKATVVNRAGRVPISGAQVEVLQNEVQITSVKTGEDGSFLIEGLQNGLYRLLVKAPGFVPSEINLTVEGFVKDLIFVSLVAEQVVSEVDDSSFAEFDMEDSGYTDNPSILFGANDPYNNIVGYGFSDVRFKNRGYDSETQDVLFAGVPLNDAITGYSPYSLWSGLNEATRSKENTIGLESHDASVGGFNGITSILGTPSNVRPGLRFSVLSNSALYRLRLMANYASGELDNGWSYAVNVSARLGGNDWVKGVYYKYLSYYAGAEKKLGEDSRIAFMTFATPGERGAQNASTQEVYDLMQDNMYNSNWGYQNGKVRNARVRSTFEPVFVVKYSSQAIENLELNATLLWRTGKNGYSALDWYDSADPRPDYYRNLPSYFYDENPDMNRYDEYQAGQQREAWLFDVNTQHLDWDRLYNVNYNSAEGRSKYVLQERRVDQNDLNLALNLKWTPFSFYTLTAGLNGRVNRTEYYQTVKDLLGGKFYVNINNFAERDYAFSEAKIQYDLDYWMNNGKAQTLYQGDKYGYDYYAQVRSLKVWADNRFDLGPFKANIAAKIGYEGFWRDGLMRNGLFPGQKADGSDYIIDGVNLSAEGGYETSYGKSDMANFLVGSVKAGAEYFIRGGHRIYANAGYFVDAPKFNGSYLSPRTRNTLAPNLTTSKTLSADINYQYSNSGRNLRVSAFYTTIKDQTDVMSFYDDSQNSFTNFAMSGIDQRHMGIELGFKFPFFISGLTIQGALSLGEYIYTSTPTMTQTIDNSSAVVVENEPVTYWAAHPVYKKDADGGYVTNEEGKYEIEKIQKHYVPSTPQLAANLGFNYRLPSYWFFSLGVNYYANSYLSMNPLYRTELAVIGPDDKLTAAAREEHRNNWFLSTDMVNQGLSATEIEYMAAQEKFDPAFVMNASIGKSWYINRQYQIGFSLEIKNMLNNTNIRTGGYEQTRLIKSGSYTRYYRFDSKYFYMQGANYMLNVYFRF